MGLGVGCCGDGVDHWLPRGGDPQLCMHGVSLQVSWHVLEVVISRYLCGVFFGAGLLKCIVWEGWCCWARLSRVWDVG